MVATDLQENEYHKYYGPYIEIVGQTDLFQELRAGKQKFQKELEAIPQDKWNSRYAEGKWTIAEIALHLIDSERIFQYRALRFGRGDTTPLPGFDQDAFVPQSKAEARSKQSVLDEFKGVRDASIHLFESFSTDELKRLGTASDVPMSVRALGFVICGHQRHHFKIINEKYL